MRGTTVFEWGTENHVLKQYVSHFAGSQSSTPVPVPALILCSPETKLEYKQPRVNTEMPAVSSGDKEKMSLALPELKSRDEEDAFEPVRKKMKGGKLETTVQ